MTFVITDQDTINAIRDAYNAQDLRFLLQGKVASISQDAIVRDKPDDKSSASKTGGAPSLLSEY